MLIREENPDEINSTLARLKGKVLLVSERSLGYPWRRLRPGNYRKILGTEWDHVVIDLNYPIPANAFPATLETVKAGGKGILILPQERLENIYRKRGGTGLFGRYLEKTFELYDESGQCPPWKPPNGLTKEQRIALRRLDGFIIGRGKVFAIIGDRGRGKSALLGAMAAKLVTIHGIKRIEVTSVTPQMSSFLKMLNTILSEQKVPFRLERDGDKWKVIGKEWRIEWIEPSKAGGKTGLVIVDEAAAVGVARLKRIIERSWKTILATTIHGYEGSGRYLVNKLLNSIDASNVIELKDPVRYPPNDPIERWLYKAFHLRIELNEDVTPIAPKKVDKVSLSDPTAFGRIAGLLAISHYRWEPSDIETILEHPKSSIFVYDGDTFPIGVAITIDEEVVEDPWSESKGNVLTRILNRVRRVEARRIMRIAVLPPLQRRGYGSKLLQFIEDDTKDKVIGAVFSNHEVLDFWLKNGYKVVYISPKYNKITGEKNIAVAKGNGVEEIANDFARTILTIAHISYRDVDTITLTKALESCVGRGLNVEIDRNYLELFLENKIEPELASRALYPCLLKYPKLIRELALPSLCVGFLLQGRSLWDLAVTHFLDIDEVRSKLNENLRALASLCLMKELEGAGSESEQELSQRGS
ncbi:hypothetical protein EYM_07340 [Ignicoccus islandicus DSM 13165]|uniref:N-acetyltransferase domain-containing protein n=1 Tax=Ignicoccus islandicus DSM 13165 TaxID=940295 RepID=A0A0U3EE88_9CREN|nr:hypothetical protein EYM_07340 [Ignicoccus islandicus DSM 13165]